MLTYGLDLISLWASYSRVKSWISLAISARRASCCVNRDIAGGLCGVDGLRDGLRGGAGGLCGVDGFRDCLRGGAGGGVGGLRGVDGFPGIGDKRSTEMKYGVAISRVADMLKIRHFESKLHDQH